MKRLLLILFIAFSFRAGSEVFYLDSGNAIPSGPVRALEVRASLSKARQGRCASWTLSWEEDSLTVSFDGRGLVDGISEGEAKIVCNGLSAGVKGMNFQGGGNSVAIEWSGNGARVLAGADELQPVMEIPDLRRPPEGAILAVNAPSGKMTVTDLIVETDSRYLDALMADCDLSALEIWEYLDSTEAKSALLGGQYRFGLLPVEGGYDLIYMEGARVNGSAWKPGMRKASLRSRGFRDHYALTWIDSTGREVPGEHYAILDPVEGILSLSFPAFPLTVRLARKD